MKLRLLKDHNGIPPGFIMKEIDRGAAEILIARGVAELVEDVDKVAKKEAKKWDRSIQSRRPRR
jgi:hypothetical protein